MRTRQGFKLRSIGNERFLTPVGVRTIDYNNILAFNSSAAYLWESIEGREFSCEDLADLLVKEYGIDRELALKDSEGISRRWLEAGVVEP